MPRYRYSQQLSPPAPFVEVTIGQPTGAGTPLRMPAQLDTAADMTVVPWSVVDGLELVQLDEIPAVGFGGHVTHVPTFLVKLEIQQLEPVMVRVLGSRDEPYVLLGRDVLNDHRIVLDGPRQILQIG